MDGEPIKLKAALDLHVVITGLLVEDDGLDVGIADRLFLITQHLEFVKASEQFVCLQMVAHLGKVGLKGVLARMLTQDDVIGLNAHGLGGEDLVGQLVGQNAVLVNARLMSEGVLAHNGLIEGGGLTDDVVDGLAGAPDLGGVDAGLHLINVGAGAHGHDHFFKRSVARALTQAVDGTLDLSRAAQHTAQGVGHRHTQVVVAMNRKFDLVGAIHAGHQVLNECLHLGGGGVAHSVGNVQHLRAPCYGQVADLDQKIGVGAGGVLTGELNIGAIFCGISSHSGGLFQDLLLGHAELILHM